MELRHLRYFRAVAESKGFREAARRLHVVQPALSQTVSDLERELGVRLLTRNSRSVRLTSEGEVFLREANEILTHADRSVELARGAARGEIGSLSVGFLGSATSFFLPRIIREYRRRFPGVRLTLREMAPAPQNRRVPRRTTGRRVHSTPPSGGRCPASIRVRIPRFTDRRPPERASGFGPRHGAREAIGRRTVRPFPSCGGPGTLRHDRRPLQPRRVHATRGQ